MNQLWTRRAALAAGVGLAGGASALAQAPRDRFALAKRMSAERGGRALLILRHGVALCEEYPNGGAPNTPLELGGVTKALATALAAAMAQDGLLELSEPAALTLGDWGLHPLKSRITIAQLLSMTSGLAAPAPGGSSPLTAASLAAEPQFEPGQGFLYDDAGYQVFAEIARRKLGAIGAVDPAAYLQERVLVRLGAAAAFARGADGAVWLGAGARMSARSAAALAEAMRLNGVWRARQLMSADALKQIFTGASANPSYGLGWSLSAGADDFAGVADLAVGSGGEGQRIYIARNRALTIVRLGGGQRDWPDTAFLQAVFADL